MCSNKQKKETLTKLFLLLHLISPSSHTGVPLLRKELLDSLKALLIYAILVYSSFLHHVSAVPEVRLNVSYLANTYVDVYVKLVSNRYNYTFTK